MATVNRKSTKIPFLKINSTIDKLTKTLFNSFKFKVDTTTIFYQSSLYSCYSHLKLSNNRITLAESFLSWNKIFVILFIPLYSAHLSKHTAL